MAKNMDYLSNYEGQWVCLDEDGKVLSHGKDAEKVYLEAKKIHLNPLLKVVPIIGEDEELIL